MALKEFDPSITADLLKIANNAAMDWISFYRHNHDKPAVKEHIEQNIKAAIDARLTNLLKESAIGIVQSKLSEVADAQFRAIVKDVQIEIPKIDEKMHAAIMHEISGYSRFVSGARQAKVKAYRLKMSGLAVGDIAIAMGLTAKEARSLLKNAEREAASIKSAYAEYFE